MIHRNSALPDDVKRTDLRQEGLRRLLNCSRELPWDVKAHHLTDFSKRSQFSGYDHYFRYHVISCALKAYELKKKEVDGERPLYRPRTWQTEERRESKQSKKTGWFSKNGEITVLFVPPTPNSTLVKALRLVANKSEINMRIVERAGTSLKRKLQRSNPFRPNQCERNDCLICRSGRKGN